MKYDKEFYKPIKHQIEMYNNAIEEARQARDRYLKKVMDINCISYQEMEERCLNCK